MCPFDFEIEKAPEILQLELIDPKQLKHFFCRIDKLRFYEKYAHKEKFPNLKQMAMRIVATMGTASDGRSKRGAWCKKSKSVLKKGS